MPKLRPETLTARREHILDAAERCFARSGFHQCTMAEICAEARISAGALYSHFPSKEALIAGSAERDRSNLTRQFAEVADAPDLPTALTKIAEYYTVDEPQYKRIMTVEIGLEATRNEGVREIFDSVDEFVVRSLQDVIERSQQEGRIKPDLNARTLAELLSVIGEGLMWRRAVIPNFDAQRLLPAITGIVEALFNPTSQQHSGAAPSAEPAEIEKDA